MTTHFPGRPPKVNYSFMKNFRKYNYKAFTIAVVKWLAHTYYGNDQRFDLARSLLEKYHRVLLTRGPAGAIAFCKGARSSLFQWLATLDDLKLPSRLGSNVRLPKALRPLRYMTDLGYPDIRLALTSLYISRGLELPESLDTKSISAPPQNGDLTELTKYLGDFWRALGVKHSGQIPRSVHWRKFHFTTKSGPNGHALWSSVADLSVLPEPLIEDLKVLGGARLAFRMDVLKRYLSFISPFFKVTGRRFRKISFIRDQEGKTRQIAIMDYWSQTALRGLHQYLFDRLRSIPQDCTFDQGSFRDKLKWGDGETFYSVDLTTFTDRWPIELICLVLKARFTDSYVNSWRRVMVGFPFETKSCGPLTYATGNPMGAYSSWNSATLSHHYVMYYCCRELGINWGDAPYVILGDDIVIKGDALAKKYKECLSILGVEFSPLKTHESRRAYEFAKRFFHLGTEVTPFPISALWESRRQPSLMLNVSVSEERKGWLSPIGTPAALSELYTLLAYSSSYRAKLRKVMDITYHIMIAFQGRKSAVEAFEPMLETYYPSLTKVPNIGVLAFAHIIGEAFRKSADPGKGREPLGLIAEQLLILITGDDSVACDAFDLIQAIPVLQVHGQIEELYLKVMRNPHSAFPLIMTGEWKSAVRALQIPISDRIYYVRNQDLVIQASFSLAKAWIAYQDREVKTRSDFSYLDETIARIFSALG